MTANEIIEDVCGALNYSASNSTQKTRVIRWINQAQKVLANHNWPELITASDSFTTTAVEGQDLTTLVDASILRVVDGTVRTTSRLLRPLSKSKIDAFDYGRTYGGDPVGFCSENGLTSFIIYPTAAGNTIYLDWVGKPTTFAADLAESGITFLPDRHNLLVEGGTRFGEPTVFSLAPKDRRALLMDYERLVADEYAKYADTVLPKPRCIIPIKF